MRTLIRSINGINLLIVVTMYIKDCTCNNSLSIVVYCSQDDKDTFDIARFTHIDILYQNYSCF